MRTRRISWSARTAVALSIATAAVTAAQLPTALGSKEWEDAADRSRRAHAEAATRLETTQDEVDRAEAALGEQQRESEAVNARLARQRKEIENLEMRVEQLGGDPDSL